MRFTSAIAAAILAFTATGVLAAPLPQLAGEGSAADSILTDTDNGVGFGIENAEDNIADNIAQIKGSVPATPALLRVRQLAGEGAAANSILSDTENGVGFGIENAEDNIAGNIAQVKGSVPATLAKRQLDKIANGAGAIGNAAGLGAVTDPVQQAGDSVDGTLTSDAANAGAQVGGTVESTLENAGSSVPKRFRRQLDKIANGAGAIGNAAGAGAVTDPVQQTGDSVDGTLTSDAANAGADVGSTVETTLENAGSSVLRL